MAVDFRGVAASFRILGLASTPHFLMTAKNASSKYIAIYEWKLFKDMTVLQNALGPIARISISTGTQGGGTALAKTKHSDAPGTNTHDAAITFTAAASADGTNSLITGLTAGVTLWQTQPMKMITLAGPAINPEPDVIPEVCRTKPWVVPPSSNLLLQLVSAGLTTDHYYCSILWEEWTTATG